MGEWGLGGEPADYDPGATTGPFGRSVRLGAGQQRHVHEVLPGSEPPAGAGSEEGMALPHWSDPPTGEVPRALAGPQGDGEALQAWRLLGSRGLHWRDDVNDWANSPGMEDLVDANDSPLTPDEPVTADPYSFDEEFERLGRERSGMGAAVPDSTPPGGSVLNEARDETRMLSDAPPTLPGRGPRGTAVGNVGADTAPGAPLGVLRVGATSPGGPAMTRGSTSPFAAQAPGGGGRNGLHTHRRPFDIGAEAGSSDGPARDLGAAVATGGGLIVLFAACYAVGPGALVALSALGLLGCALEAFAMFQSAGFRPATIIGSLGSAGAVLAVYWRGSGSLSVVVAVVVAASMVWYLAHVVEARPVVNVAVTVMGFAWVGVLGSFAALLLAAHHGEHLFLGAVAPTVVADLAAWFVGSRFGSHHLAPSTSPGKTWEGFAAGALAAVVTGAVIGKVLTPWGGLAHGVELGVVVAIAAPLGDLVQSMVKRDLRLKDSGVLLPGHGGLLDRFDSLLFVLPATYFLVVALHIVK